MPTASVRSASPRPRSSIAASSFLDDAALAAARDWYWFVLEELNGLGTMLRYEEAEGGGRAEITRRARSIVETLAWDSASAVAQTWSFVETALHEPEDAWGPALVLRALGAAPDCLEAWLGGLALDARAFAEHPATW